MNFSILFNPFKLINRLAIEINRRKRKNKLKRTPAAALSLGHLDSLELLELIKKDGFSAAVIFDIGANIGTWTLLAKSFFPDAEIHAFEPLDNHVQQFLENTKSLANAHIHSFCLGSENKETKINISSFSDSSSILDATPLENEQFGIKKSGEVNVIVKKLDNLISQGILSVPDVIKLDVQGYELEVLKGVAKYLDQIKYLIIEVSFKEYYQDQPLFLDIASYLDKYHFIIYAFAHSTPLGQELGQIDVLFKNRK